MKCSKAFIFFLFLSGSLSLKAQKSDVFAAVQTGSPFRVLVDDGSPVIWNYCFGAEHYFINKLSVALSYRKSFYVSGRTEAVQIKEVNDYHGYNYFYTEEYNLYSIEFESKYFFEQPDDDGLFLASGFSFQHIAIDVNVISAEPTYSNTGSSPPALSPGKFTDEINIYPVGIKLGHRNSGDVLVFDYFLGAYYHIGVGSATRTNEQYLSFFEFKEMSFIVGIKLGAKF